MKYALLPLGLSVSLIGINVASGALIASYNDGIASGSSALNNLTTTPGLTVSNLARVGIESSDNGFITRTSFGSNNPTPAGPTAGSAASSEWLFIRSSRGTRGVTTPSATATYFGFTVTNTGFGPLDLGTLKFDYAAVTNEPNPITGKAQAFINVDNGGFFAIGPEFTSTDTGTAGFDSVTSALVDLSSVTGANLVEIRIAIADDVDLDGRASFIQGIQLETGSGAVIPEPSSAMLSILGALALITRRRR